MPGNPLCPFWDGLSDPFKGQVTSKFWMKRSRLESPVSSHFSGAKQKHTHTHTHHPSATNFAWNLRAPGDWSNRSECKDHHHLWQDHLGRYWANAARGRRVCRRRQEGQTTKNKRRKTTPSYLGMRPIYTWLFMIITIVVTYKLHINNWFFDPSSLLGDPWKFGTLQQPWRFFDLRIRRDLWARAQGFHPKTAQRSKKSHDPHASNTCFVYVCAIMEKIYERFKISQLNFQVQVFQAFPSFLDYTFLWILLEL